MTAGGPIWPCFFALSMDGALVICTKLMGLQASVLSVRSRGCSHCCQLWSLYEVRTVGPSASPSLLPALIADHAGYRVKSFAASADCCVAVIVLFDSTVAVWDMVNMECSCMLQSWGDRDAARVHTAGVNAAYLSPSGSRAVTISGDHTARVWDIATAECRCVLRGVNQLMLCCSFLRHLAYTSITCASGHLFVSAQTFC